MSHSLPHISEIQNETNARTCHFLPRRGHASLPRYAFASEPLVQFAVILTLSLRFFALGEILVNEIASVGKAGFCGGADYIELYNSGPNPLHIGGYFLSDSSSTFAIPSGTIVPDVL
jgi:hypothetical protein